MRLRDLFHFLQRKFNKSQLKYVLIKIDLFGLIWVIWRVNVGVSTIAHPHRHAITITIYHYHYHYFYYKICWRHQVKNKSHLTFLQLLIISYNLDTDEKSFICLEEMEILTSTVPWQHGANPSAGEEHVKWTEQKYSATVIYMSTLKIFAFIWSSILMPS